MSRQKIHFTPKKGWINDPNGLIKVDGTYHIFYQHYPDDTHWGPMHWGHATSKDLMHFEDLPIALYPTEDEFIFSGSAILDEGNVSGFGENAMVLFYTAHNPKTGEQQQCIAYSKDHVGFTKYDGNPVIGNVAKEAGFKPDFRDPKVVKNAIKGGYTMALAAGPCIEFYHSFNLLSWKKTGDFYPGKIGYGGICECPDLICFGDKYMLTMSLVLENGSNVSQYFVGTFDGDTFQSTQDFDELMLLDQGPDNYAAVTFFGTDTPVLMGWGENWTDARENTAEGYFGKLTIARKLELILINNRQYLAQTPIVDGVSSEEASIKTFCIGEGETININESFSVSLEGDTLDINGKKIKRVMEGPAKACALCDNGYLEVFLDNGLISFSQNL